MKKWFALLLTIALLATLVMPASAAVTGTYVDEVPVPTPDATSAFAPEVVEWSSVGEGATNSHRVAVENNPDLGLTQMLKTAEPRSAMHTEYVVYKMAQNIAGFELLVNCCAGLGDPLEDLSIFISKNGTDGWQEVSTQATKYTFDDSIYLTFDKAYWHRSTLMNKAKIPTGYKYLKIQFNPCTESVDVPWNVAIDTVKITMGSNVAAPTIPAADKFKSYEQLAKEKEDKTTTTTKAPVGGDNNTTTKAPVGGNNNTQAPVGGNNTTTQAPVGDNNTTAAIGDTTTAADGAVTDPTGDTVTEPTGDTAAPDGNDNQANDETTGADNNANVGNDPADPEPKGNALPWIIGGAVVLAAAVVVVIIVLKKKKA